MKKIFSLALIVFICQNINAQCSVTASASPTTVYCGQSASLTAFGLSGSTAVISANFNSDTLDAGWSSTPGAVGFTNPCSPSGADGTTHAWMDNATNVPRAITSPSCNLAAATSGATICFDMKFAEQGSSAPCEGPDEPDEGVYIQYSIDTGATWITIHYFDPNGGNDSLLINWNNWCFAIPVAALTPYTIFRWYQSGDSGSDYDHWGIDNIGLYPNDVNASLIWLHDGYSYGTGNSGGINPTPVSPTVTTIYTAQLTTGSGAVCTQSVTVTVLPPVFDMNISATPNPLCLGNCATISAAATEIISPAGRPTYENNESVNVTGESFSTNINVQGLNMTSLTSSSITQLVINSFIFTGSSLCTNVGGCPCGTGTVAFGAACTTNPGNFEITLTSPGGCSIVLVPLGAANGNYANTVFVPAGPPIGGSSFPGGGPWGPSQPFSNLNGCDPNGVWTLSFNTPATLSGFGFSTGWSISFDDPAITGPATFSWSPVTDMTGSGTLTPTVCPSDTITYNLVLANPTPGCPLDTASITINVTPYLLISVTPDSSIISPGGDISLTASGADTYTWAPAEGLSATSGATVTASPEITTTYTITGTSGVCTSDTTVTVMVSGSVGLAEESSKAGGIAIYPNPAQNVLNISYHLPDKETQAIVNTYDHIGKLISSKVLYGNSGFASFNVEELADGIYVYNVVINNAIISSQRIAITK